MCLFYALCQLARREVGRDDDYEQARIVAEQTSTKIGKNVGHTLEEARRVCSILGVKIFDLSEFSKLFYTKESDMKHKDVATSH